MAFLGMKDDIGIGRHKGNVFTRLVGAVLMGVPEQVRVMKLEQQIGPSQRRMGVGPLPSTEFGRVVVTMEFEAEALELEVVKWLVMLMESKEGAPEETKA